MPTLKEWTEGKSRSVYYLSKKWKMDRSYLSRLIRGERIPSLKTARDIKLLTGGEVDYEDWFRQEEVRQCSELEGRRSIESITGNQDEQQRHNELLESNKENS
jgi:hypothetical protein